MIVKKIELIVDVRKEIDLDCHVVVVDDDGEEIDDEGNRFE